jgi:general secretion pathway protein J
MGLLTLRAGQNKAHQQRGFTLIEAVISVALLAIISLMSYQALDLIMGANERSRTDLADEAQLQRAWQIINRDMFHLRKRGFKDGLGGTEPAYITNKSEFGVRFSRGGGPMVRTNPSGIRRIEYRFDDDQQLVRQSWGIAESPRFSDGVVQVLLDHVSEVNFEHLDQTNNFVPSWPPISGGGSSLPKMIRVTISLEDGTQSTRLFLGVSG